jgi:hypothetical protein
MTLAVAGVAKLHGKTAGIKVRTAFTVFVHQARVGKLGATEFVDIR